MCGDLRKRPKPIIIRIKTIPSGFTEVIALAEQTPIVLPLILPNVLKFAVVPEQL